MIHVRCAARDFVRVVSLALFVFVSACGHEVPPAGPPQPVMVTAAPLPAPARPAGESATAMKAPIMLVPEAMKWVDSTPPLPPGAKIAVIDGNPATPNALFTIRAKVPANYTVMPHWHPSDEHVTVLSGVLVLGHGDRFDPTRATTLPAGSFAVLPAGHHHFATTTTETEIQIHSVGPWAINYINQTDAPRTALGK